MSLPIIHFDYEFSLNGVKTRLLLTAAGISFKRINQHPVLPRPDLERLGIAHRRVPLLAIGKDIYADTSAIFDVVLNQLGGREQIERSKPDAAFEAWGRTTFQSVVPLVPSQMLTPAFLEDRKTIAPVLMRPDLATLAPSATAEFQNRLAQVEDQFLADSPFINGNKLSVADIHIVWPLRSALLGLGLQNQPGFGKDAFPKVWNLIESLPTLKSQALSSENGLEVVLSADWFVKDPKVSEDDPLAIPKGSMVAVESTDSVPGSHPQRGRLIGSSRHELVLDLESGIHLHFPRNGYIVREVD